MDSTEVKLQNECIKRIDNHIFELLELKKMITNGIETKEKVHDILTYINDTHYKYNEMDQIKNIICKYNDVLQVIYKY